MKFICQFGIILAVTFVGEVIHKLIPLPIPSSVYGLLIMLLCLKTKIVQLKKVEETGNFLLEIMPLMFIPAAVGLLTVWNKLIHILIPIIIITFLTTVIVMVTTGKMTQFIIKRNKDNVDENNEYDDTIYYA